MLSRRKSTSLQVKERGITQGNKNTFRKKVEIPTSEDSFEKPAVIEKPVKKPVNHDRFKCEQCEERLDTRNCLTT